MLKTMCTASYNGSAFPTYGVLVQNWMNKRSNQQLSKDLVVWPENLACDWQKCAANTQPPDKLAPFSNTEDKPIWETDYATIPVLTSWPMAAKSSTHADFTACAPHRFRRWVNT